MYVSSPVAHSKWATSLWDVALSGCKVRVKQLSLKGTCAARPGAPISKAWLRDGKVSASEAGFSLRETRPLPRNILGNRGSSEPRVYGAANEPLGVTETGHDKMPVQRMQQVTWTYPDADGDSAKSGLGCTGNHCLSHLAESIFMNVGGLYLDDKARGLPMTDMRVGATIVLRARESRAQGEGL